MWAWLQQWLRTRLARGRGGHRDRTTQLDAWRAYERLLVWAESQGVARRPAETPGQFATRLGAAYPETATVVDLVTQTFEWERYGGINPSRERVDLLGERLRSLS